LSTVINEHDYDDDDDDDDVDHLKASMELKFVSLSGSV